MPTQNTRRIRPFSFLAGFMISVLALSASAYAQSPAKPGPDGITVVNPQPQAQTANSAQLPKATAHNEGSHESQEGIKVHGHWIIDVKNPDGSLADHRDFENSLSNATSWWLFCTAAKSRRISRSISVAQPLPAS